MNDPQIGVAMDSPAGAAAELAIVFEEITGKRPKSVHLGDYAGPNDTVQLLASYADWILIAKAVGAIYGIEIIKEAAKSTWKNIAPKISGLNEDVFGRLCGAVRSAKTRKSSVVFGLPRTPISGRRHIGIEIESDKPEEIARAVAFLSIQGEEIDKRLDEWDLSNKNSRFYYKENSDCSVKLFIADDGSVEMKFQRAEIVDKIEPFLLAGPLED